MSEILSQFVEVVVSAVGDLGYLGIFLLMTIESSFVPFPSEVVLIPAGYLAHQGEMDFVAVVAAGIAGSLVGALINYSLSLWLGRAFILRYGHYFFLPREKFLSLEEGFRRHGAFATFFGRLIFGIRQWISIPAGLSRMPLLPFSLLTSAGAGVWVVLLVSLGYVLGQGEEVGSFAKVLGYWMAGAIVIITFAYVSWWVPRKKKRGTPAGP